VCVVAYKFVCVFFVGSRSVEHEVFLKYYPDLIQAFRTNTFAAHFVAAHIITMNENDEISNLQPRDGSLRLLRSVSAPLETGQTDNLYSMLQIMQAHGNDYAQKLSQKIYSVVHGGGM